MVAMHARKCDKLDGSCVPVIPFQLRRHYITDLLTFHSIQHSRTHNVKEGKKK